VSREVIITIAPTGGVARKEQNPALPITPHEIANVVERCAAAGASVAALHARRSDQAATTDPDLYREINELVRERCEIIINNSTGGGVDGDLLQRTNGYPEISFAERLKGLDAGAEMCTLDCQTQVFSFGDEEIIFNTSPSRCEALASGMKSRGIKPEWEVMCPSHIVQDMQRLIAAGYDEPPHYVNIVLGMDRNVQGAMPFTPKILALMVDLLPQGAMFCVTALGAAQLPATTQSILLGGHVRVGLEDNLYYSKGVLATNEQLVERTVRIVQELGHEPATPARAREMLGLPTPVAEPSARKR
jgi:3-keto-5-aminohexanoate cleavage enzyme